MAEGYLKFFNKELEVYSAGTKPADKVNPFAVKVMKEKGIDISNGIAEDVDKYINQYPDCQMLTAILPVCLWGHPQRIEER